MVICGKWLHERLLCSESFMGVPEMTELHAIVYAVVYKTLLQFDVVDHRGCYEHSVSYSCWSVRLLSHCWRYCDF